MDTLRVMGLIVFAGIVWTGVYIVVWRVQTWHAEKRKKSPHEERAKGE